MFKHYYKGQMIRASKTKQYAFAVVREKENGEIVVWGCASNLKGAEKALKDANAVRLYHNGVEDCKIVELEIR